MFLFSLWCSPFRWNLKGPRSRTSPNPKRAILGLYGKFATIKQGPIIWMTWRYCLVRLSGTFEEKISETAAFRRFAEKNLKGLFVRRVKTLLPPIRQEDCDKEIYAWKTVDCSFRNRIFFSYHLHHLLVSHLYVHMLKLQGGAKEGDYEDSLYVLYTGCLCAILINMWDQNFGGDYLSTL